MRGSIFAAVILVLGAATLADGGIFFRRDGSRREPVRTVARAVVQPIRQAVQNTAVRREARGAVAVFPGVRAAAVRAASGQRATGWCSTCGPGTQTAGAGADVGTETGLEHVCYLASCDAAAEAAFLKAADEPVRYQALMPTTDETRLAQLEARLSFKDRFIWKMVKKSKAACNAIAAYGNARGAQIDPNNLVQVLEAFLAFLTKLLPLLMPLFG